jgi:hypothetical protein
VSAEIIPLNQPDPPQAGGWQPLEVVIPRRLPRIPPGEYQGVSIGLKRYEFSKRIVVRLDFDVYEGDAGLGHLLARLSYYMRWTGKKPAATSKLGRLLHVARLESSRGRPVSLASLAHKLWRIQVVDAEHDSGGDPLTPATTYSIVKRVLERLT